MTHVKMKNAVGLLLCIMAAGAVAMPDYASYTEGAAPQGVLMALYDGPASRGFSWQTAADVTAGSVWLLAGEHGAADAAAFLAQGVRYEGTATAVTTPAATCHRVAVTNLVPGTTYSYRLGAGDANDVYGTFTVKDASLGFTAST